MSTNYSNYSKLLYYMRAFSFVLHDLFNLFISLQLSDGSDYTTRRQMLVFDQNNLDLNITVPVLDNDIHEPLEDFFGRLETEDSSTTLTPNSTVIRILDDDCRLHEYIGPYAGTIVTITETSQIKASQWGIKIAVRCPQLKRKYCNDEFKIRLCVLIHDFYNSSHTSLHIGHRPLFANACGYRNKVP